MSDKPEKLGKKLEDSLKKSAEPMTAICFVCVVALCFVAVGMWLIRLIASLFVDTMKIMFS